ncbi:hypothetical protein SKAU_G00010910 [Synaphobranchus kaupii]|uniref:Uncharacterized protein n=1 Tax=Synaphobranchus kaupii TaxID=118154 RepID=A0A9Q1GB44_SYNKA|nr:hypothetical protein SKAU_G00010910 [Synaphobranchus kaupii]
MKEDGSMTRTCLEKDSYVTGLLHPPLGCPIQHRAMPSSALLTPPGRDIILRPKTTEERGIRNATHEIRRCINNNSQWVRSGCYESEAVRW